MKLYFINKSQFSESITLLTVAVFPVPGTPLIYILLKIKIKKLTPQKYLIYKVKLIYPVNSSLIFLDKNECMDLNSTSRHGKCLGAACKCKLALAFSRGLHGTFAPLSNLLLAEAVKFFTCA